MLNFSPGVGVFALAGLVAAAGPVVIHLLNRRRYRVVNWAAMDFLLEAVQRNRRMLHLRDLLLLALRTAAVLLFGLALARPMISDSAGSVDDNQPVHAVLVVDNSLSMGYEKFDHTLLDESRSKAKEFLEALPDGSRISVLPLCGSAAGVTLDAYRTREDARDALDRIEVVDRSGSGVQAIDAAMDARARVPEFKDATRVVFFGDQQAANWPAGGLSGLPTDAPDLQVVSIAAGDENGAAENSWIESFAVQDGIADVETPAVLTAVVRHSGPPRGHVQVTLSVDGTDVASETIDLEGGQTREVTFRHRFDAAAEAGKPVFVPAKVSLPPDHLPQDDQRCLAVPVVAALPVVFVDQYGTDEDPQKNRLGETRLLRRLLAPVTSRGEAQRQLVQIRQLKIEQLDRAVLEDARLVVIAGIASPEESVPLLRSFVQQGGQLVIVAGAEFDPSVWNQLAWLDGAGVLPAPLKPQLFGKTPEESSEELKPFFLAFGSMSHDVFQLENVPRDELEDLYSLPLFFKAVEADVSDEVAGALVESEIKRIGADREFLAQADEKSKHWAELEAKGALTESNRGERRQIEQRLSVIRPQWLSWPEQTAEADRDLDARELGERSRPQVLAAFDNRLPFLVQRRIGRGQVLLVASGMLSSWNTLPKTNAMLLMDRMLRGMLERTLPTRNFSSVEQIVLPVADRNALYSVARPDSTAAEPVSVDALGGDLYGVTLRNVFQRGIYKVTAVKGDGSADPSRLPSKLWEAIVAVNGPSRESDPAVLDEAGLRERLGNDVHFRWVARGDAISLAGGNVSGQNLWKWLLGLVLGGMLLELAILARPLLSQGDAA